MGGFKDHARCILGDAQGKKRQKKVATWEIPILYKDFFHGQPMEQGLRKFVQTPSRDIPSSTRQEPKQPDGTGPTLSRE